MASLKGGDKLEAALRAIAQKVSKPGTLRAGFLENATYPDGTPVALVAAANEFGTKRIPARPFFRNMIAAKSDEWAPAIGHLLPQNDYDVPKSARARRRGHQGPAATEHPGHQLSRRYVAGAHDFGNHPETSRARRWRGAARAAGDSSAAFDKPLDDGHMRSGRV